MRPRKELLPLTLSNLQTALEPGKPYTVEHLACIFDASPHALLEVLETATAAGTLLASQKVRGFRRTYWTPVPPREDVASRRTPPELMTGEMSGYGEALRRVMDLCMLSRRT